MKKLINKILVFLLLMAYSIMPIEAKGITTPYGETPYEHIPIDTFIAGFPHEALIMLGLIAYIVGAVYIFNSALLRQVTK
jgi:hypothetical protein